MRGFSVHQFKNGEPVDDAHDLGLLGSRGLPPFLDHPRLGVDDKVMVAALVVDPLSVVGRTQRFFIKIVSR